MQFLILLSSVAFFFFFFFFSSGQHLISAAVIPPKHNNATDRSSLLTFKSAISVDPYRAFTQWNDTVHFCGWHGVTCGGPRHPERVVALELPSLGLVGTISPDLANLSFLRSINLSSNHLNGQIPPQLGNLSRLERLDLATNSLQGYIPSEFGSLSSLTLLSLSNNTITGQIPPVLANASSLRALELSYNNLSGAIPPSLGTLPNLVFLYLYNNVITGQIPPVLGNASSLRILDLSNNNLSGVIPPSLGKLSKLSALYLGFNNLDAGAIPPALWNLSRLTVLGLDSCGLNGSLPRDIGQKLPNLQFLSLADNHLHGEIPSSLANASQLYVIQLAQNRFSGTIPATLGRLQYLMWLALFKNQLEAREANDWSFVASLSNCTLLTHLELGSNNLGGQLPSSIANLSSSLQILEMSSNDIHGSIPQDIGNLAVSLTWLDLGSNALTGPIPVSLALLNNLYTLYLSNNNLSGEIPPNIGNLSQIFQFYLDSNSIDGSIPTSLGNCKSLGVLDLGNNKLTGTVPKDVVSIATLSNLTLSNNLLQGSIPSEVGSLINLVALNMSRNKLSGEIPFSIGNCQLLQFLYLDDNSFQGSIPTSLSALRGLQELDLSQNNFSGKVPTFLENFHDLYFLNLSSNNFEGELPTNGVFANSNAVSVSGNHKLCGGISMLHLQTCYVPSPKKKHMSLKITIIILVVSTFICLFFLFVLGVARYRRQEKSRRKPTIDNPIGDQYVNVSYAQLVKGTDRFSEENLIGSGGFCSVYRGRIEDHEHDIGDVAVKVFDLQQRGALKSFVAECDAYRNIRHRNLIKIITACSSIDFRGNDFKAIVFEFKINGSLESWLHPEENDHNGPKNLSIIQRINIAIDVASAVEYLHHHHSENPIIHCDLKPSNILLDDDMMALVSDFGIVRFMKESMGSNSTSSLGIKGTIGYIAPEYGMTNMVSTYGDVYSFGILLFELFTGKRPTDHDTFKEGLCLRSFVEIAFPERIADVIDARILQEVIDARNDGRFLDCVTSIFGIGLSCTKDSPMERMEMTIVTNELKEMRKSFLEN